VKSQCQQKKKKIGWGGAKFTSWERTRKGGGVAQLRTTGSKGKKKKNADRRLFLQNGEKNKNEVKSGNKGGA